MEVAECAVDVDALLGVVAAFQLHLDVVVPLSFRNRPDGRLRPINLPPGLQPHGLAECPRCCVQARRRNLPRHQNELGGGSDNISGGGGVADRRGVDAGVVPSLCPLGSNVSSDLGQAQL